MNKKNDLNKEIHSPMSYNNKTGGVKKEWNNIFQLGQKVDYSLSPVGEDLVKQNYELKSNLEFDNPRVINPSNYDGFYSLCIDIRNHWVKRRRNKLVTIDKRIARAKTISSHPVFPVNFFDLNPDQVVAYLDYREYSENATPDSIRNDYKVITTFAKAYGFDYNKWNYKPPRKPQPKVKIVPMPCTVHSLIHHKYSNDPYENALYQYIMCHSFIIGMRMPSEIVSLKVDDVFLDDGYIIIHEAKKYGQKRQIFPEKEILNMNNRKSLMNWIDKWRPRVENQYSDDYLYLLPSGKPFNKEYLRQKLSKLGKQVWPYYHPYISREWSSISRLIQSKVLSGSYDIYAVRDWLGHEDLKTTQSYTRYAQQYYKSAPFDWIKAVLNSNMKLLNSYGEDNGLKMDGGIEKGASD